MGTEAEFDGNNTNYDSNKVQKKGGKASVNWRCFHCFPGFGGKTPKTELTGAESSKSQLQLKLTESDEGYLRTEDHVDGSGKRKGLSSSSEGAGHLSQVGMDWSGEERASTSKSDGTMKHLKTGDEYNGHGKASTNSSQRAKDGKPVGSAAKRYGKRPKY